MSHPLVSVAMVVCNVERYLAEAIESVLGQTFRDFEFIVVDFGSTDDTFDLSSPSFATKEETADRWQTRYPDLRAIKEGREARSIERRCGDYSCGVCSVGRNTRQAGARGIIRPLSMDSEYLHGRRGLLSPGRSARNVAI
jgi:Glycosyl transferase family 2